MEEAILKSPFADGFSRLWYSVLESVGKPFEYNEETSLEKRINVVLAAKKEKFKPSDKKVRLFCETIGDDNPLHQDDAYAQSLGFERRIVPGTQINANLEQFVEGVAKIINKSLNGLGQAFNFTKSSIHFPTPFYPNDSIRWQVTNYNIDENDIELEIAGADKKRNIAVPKIKATINRTYPEPQNLKDTGIYTRKFIYRVSKHSLDNYLEATGDEKSDVIPWSYPVALVTSALLEISKDKDGKPTGINKGMKFNFYQRPEFGEVNVKVLLSKEPLYLRRVNQYKYDFKTECSQNDNSLFQGEITVVSEKKL